MPKPPLPAASEILRHNLLILVSLPSCNHLWVQSLLRRNTQPELSLHYFYIHSSTCIHYKDRDSYSGSALIRQPKVNEKPGLIIGMASR